MRYLLIFFVLCQGAGFAQQKNPDSPEGAIESVQYEIVVDKKNTVPEATRNFETVGPRNEVSEPVPVKYNPKDVPFKSPDGIVAPRPLRIKDESLSKVFSNYLSGGLGNYGATYFNGSITTKRSKENYLGAKLYHQGYSSGSVDGKNSGSMENNLKMFGSLMKGGCTLKGDVNYSNSSGYFYGYPAGRTPVEDRNAIAQYFQKFSVGAGVENTKPSVFNYALRTKVSYVEDRYKAKETDLEFFWNSAYTLKNDNKGLLDASYNLIARKDEKVEAAPRYIFRIAPMIKVTPFENLSVVAGFRVAFTNDSIDKKFHIYPHIQTKYLVAPNWEVYGKLTGDIDKVSLHTITAENFWVAPSIEIFNANRKFDFGLGIRGALGKMVDVQAGINFAKLKNLYYFQNDITNSAKFNTYLDNGITNRTNLFLETSTTINSMIRWTFRADYYQYKTDVLDSYKKKVSANNPLMADIPAQNIPFHKPTYKVSTSVHVNFAKKISGDLSLITLGGIKAINVNLEDGKIYNVVTLGTSVNIDLKVEYWLSHRISLFVRGGNLTSGAYQTLQYYPVRRIQVLGGLCWSF